LKELQETRGLTYIFISHDLSVVKFMADMIAVMNQGRILEFGPAETIYAYPRDPYTRKLIAATPRDDLESIRNRSLMGCDAPMFKTTLSEARRRPLD
jgi:peptide/nickel transport system ATP-binding protein